MSLPLTQNESVRPPRILLIGCGRMGRALAVRWAAENDIIVYDPAASVPPGTVAVPQLDFAQTGAVDVIFLAVKPQVFPDIATELTPYIPSAICVSIMAGIKLAAMELALGRKARVVRAMPNTPAAIGAGMSVAIAGQHCAPPDIAIVDRLLRAAGATAWIEREADMDAVTAISGSGPAYFFRFTEALERAAMRAGIEPKLAETLARATFTGAAALASRDAASPMAILREEVTSPGGTTAAGLAALGQSFDDQVAAAVDQAAARSRSLAMGS